MSIIYVWGPYSGAHVNPAVSFGFAVSGQMNWGLMFGYWIAQVLGAICGAALVTYFFGSGEVQQGDLVETFPWKAVLYEAFLTFFLVIAYLFIYRNPLLAIISGLAIGLVLTVAVLGGHLLTGGSTNPARSIGTGIFSGNLTNSWIYIVGPLLGALLAALIYKLFTMDMSCCNKLDECGNKVLDECGNQIKECRRPVLDSCGNVVSDCDGIKYETYSKIEKPVGYKQETFASTLGVDLSSRATEPKHHMPDKLDSVLPCDIIDNPLSKSCTQGDKQISSVMLSNSMSKPATDNCVNGVCNIRPSYKPSAAGMTNPMAGMTNPMAGMTNPMAGMTNPMAGMTNPMAGMTNPMAGMTNPMAGMTNPMGSMTNPMGSMAGNLSSAMSGAMGRYM
jgi:hypothetical protein